MALISSVKTFIIVACVAFLTGVLAMASTSHLKTDVKGVATSPTLAATATVAPTATVQPTPTATPLPTATPTPKKIVVPSPKPTAIPVVKEQPVQTSSGSNDEYYTNVNGNQVHVPDANSSGASAQCKDGTFSHSQSRRGTCSGHGGVAVWY